MADRSSGGNTMVADNPAFIRLEAKVDGLISEVREYKSNNDKTYVTRTEFEVFKATQTPTTKLVADVVKYIIIFIVGAGLSLLVLQAK
jgi:hypothetical protein